jgi:hypothetical protein
MQSTSQKGADMRAHTRFAAVAAIAALAALFAGVASAGQPVTQTLNPAPPSFETCKATGVQTICQGARTLPPYGPDDTGIACGSGSNAFDIFDSGVESQLAARYYDANGNLTRRVIHETYDSAFSNPLTGATIPYTVHFTLTDTLTIPGSLEAGTETITGNGGVFTVPGMGAVFLNAGRLVTVLPDLTLEFSAGPQQTWDYYVNGNTSVVDELCAALGAS